MTNNYFSHLYVIILLYVIKISAGLLVKESSEFSLDDPYFDDYLKFIRKKCDAAKRPIGPNEMYKDGTPLAVVKSVDGGGVKLQTRDQTEDGANILAQGTVEQTMKKIGWNSANIGYKTPGSEDERRVQSYAAGVLEGHASYQTMWLFYVLNSMPTAKSGSVKDWLVNSYYKPIFNNFMESQGTSDSGNSEETSNMYTSFMQRDAERQSQQFKRNENRYNNEVMCLNCQLLGMLDGYNTAVDMDDVSQFFVNGRAWEGSEAFSKIGHLNWLDGLVLNSDGQVPELEMLSRNGGGVTPPRNGGVDTGLDQEIFGSFLQRQKKFRKKFKKYQGKLHNIDILNEPQHLQKVVYPHDANFTHHHDGEELHLPTRCTGLVSLVRDKETGRISNLVAGHTTWESYREMERFEKRYNFPQVGQDDYHVNSMLENGKMKREPASPVHFSSYPGCISSTDDWLTSNGMLLFETTTSFKSADVAENLGVLQRAPDFMRIMAATRLATDTDSFKDFFTNYDRPSGTYNSQWMGVDYKKAKTAIDNGQDHLDPGTFIVLETSPGNSKSTPGIFKDKDMTNWLNEKNHFGSFNEPMFPETRAGLGYYDDFTGDASSSSMFQKREQDRRRQQKNCQGDDCINDPRTDIRGNLLSLLSKGVYNAHGMMRAMQYNAPKECVTALNDHFGLSIDSCQGHVPSPLSASDGGADTKVVDFVSMNDGSSMWLYSGPSKNQDFVDGARSKYIEQEMDSMWPVESISREWTFPFIYSSNTNICQSDSCQPILNKSLLGDDAPEDYKPIPTPNENSQCNYQCSDV